MDYAKTESELLVNMESCFQFETMNMLQHGESVHQAYNELIEQLEGGKQIIELPPWVTELYEKLKTKLYDDETIKRYQILHDCGKPLCRQVDEDQKQRFPDHANWSYSQYCAIYGSGDDVSNLILHDMDFHTLKGEELIELWKHPYAATLYFTAWAEIMANSKMFGGFDSTSFKIKKKALIQAGKKYD